MSLIDEFYDFLLKFCAILKNSIDFEYNFKLDKSAVKKIVT